MIGLNMGLWMAAAVRSFAEPPEPPDALWGSVTLNVGGGDRTFDVYVPHSAPASAPALICYHPASSSPALLQEQTRFNSHADRYGFVVAWPAADGISWNDSDADAESDADDVGFTDAIVAYLTDLGVDEDRIYVCGWSSGGMLVQRLACERQFAGYGVVATGIAETLEAICTPPAPPVPMVILHGTADANVPFDGGENSSGRSFMSSDDTFAFWAGEAGSALTGLVSDNLLDSASDGTTVTRNKYPDADVTQYVITEGGHNWPGGYSGGNGLQTHDIDASVIMLEKFGLDTPAVAGEIMYVVSSSASAGSGLNPPAEYIEDDLIIVSGLHNDSSTIPTPPAGWLQPTPTSAIAVGGAANGNAAGWAYKIVDEAAETGGAWTGAQQRVCGIYRGVDTSAPFLAAAMAGTSNGTIQIPALDYVDPTAWVQVEIVTANSIEPPRQLGPFMRRHYNGRRSVYDSAGPLQTFAGLTEALSGIGNCAVIAVAMKSST